MKGRVDMVEVKDRGEGLEMKSVGQSNERRRMGAVKTEN